MQYHKYAERVGCPIYEEGRTTMGKLIDLTGKRFGRLTVIERDYETQKKKHSNGTYWKCKCDCGNSKSISARCLTYGTTQSCGCLGLETKQNNFNQARCKRNKVRVEGTDLFKLTAITPRSDNKSGITGVRWDKRYQLWVARFTLKGNLLLDKSFKNKQDAINARKEAEEKYFKPILEKYDYEKSC